MKEVRKFRSTPDSLAPNFPDMPTVALIGPELFPIPPIRGGATELFIDCLAAHLRRYRPVIIGPGDPELPAREMRGPAEYWRVSLRPWQQWLYRRYRHLLPVYDRRVAPVARQPHAAEPHKVLRAVLRGWRRLLVNLTRRSRKRY